MHCYDCDTFELPLPEKHRFPLSKYRLLREALCRHDSLGKAVELLIPPAATDEQILLAHDRDYLEALKSGTLDPKIQRRIGFPYSLEMVERSRRSVGATLAASRAALDDGVAVNLAGGTHHAFRGSGEGFCVLNDSAIALRVLQKEGRIRTAIIIDTDVHQGNGTAAILANDPTIFTFSIHGEKNFPFKKERSDLDVGLPDGTQDDEYLVRLDEALRSMQSVAADLIIFQSGADPYVDDKLGRLSLSKHGLRERDKMVYDWCETRSLPVTVTMGGGYCPDVEEIVAIHLQTIEEGFRLFFRRSAERLR